MPWAAVDADKHIKGLSDTQKRAWAEIANSALTEYGDEGRAIRTANAKAKLAHKSTNYKKEQAQAKKEPSLKKVPKNK